MSLSDEQLSALMNLRKLYLRNLGAVVRRRNELTAALQVGFHARSGVSKLSCAL